MKTGHRGMPHEWLIHWMQLQNMLLWGVADLSGFPTPVDETGHGFPFAFSWAVPMDPLVMEGIQRGPTRAYADEYARVNALINELAVKLSEEIKGHGSRALALAASDRTDTITIRGAFPHKTAATRAGLGWIGCHCQLITPEFGPWVRLGTVFTDMALPGSTPAEKSFCGRCTLCVDACPAGALKGAVWYPGLPREEILDVHACDRWKKEHYSHFNKGHNCGICSAVCPYGRKVLKRNER
ncbi:MAG: epoxyqueuosine reductase [Nitrospiraceae bacterium]|nr:MAG: epoxyqueuosine reductase [Nitrospiraceae bacterium]